MAREEQDREDLLREATAFVDRAEFAVAGFESPVFVGFRENSAASVYFGPDRVYHFNADGELRRAYRDGLLYKADRGELVSLDRRRDAHETSLVARRLSAEDTSAFLNELNTALLRFATAFSSHQGVTGGEVTSAATAANGQTAAGCIEKWLTELPRQFRIAQSPNVV